LSKIKQLAGQTMWYGLSSIAARFINYLLTPYLTYKFSNSEYGEMSMVYAFIPFMNVVFTYGMETAFFVLPIPTISKKYIAQPAFLY
jgi:O-antigen/teichoic acid export membrane protein